METLQAMRFQEDRAYQVKEWSTTSVDGECRAQMAAWCYQVVDFCHFRRETAAIAMSYMDRFMSISNQTDDRSYYRLACMSSLYLAVKIHEASAMDPQFVAKLSHGAYAPKDIERMENVLLKALQWRVNPPTAMAFARGVRCL